MASVRVSLLTEQINAARATEAELNAKEVELKANKLAADEKKVKEDDEELNQKETPKKSKKPEMLPYKKVTINYNNLLRAGETSTYPTPLKTAVTPAHGLVTPPNSVSPHPAAQSEHGVHPFTPAKSESFIEAHLFVDHGVNATDLSHITPHNLARYWVGQLLLEHGPLSISRIVRFLSAEHPVGIAHFAEIPETKAADLVTAALELKYGGSKNEIIFSRIRTETWSAKMRPIPTVNNISSIEGQAMNSNLPSRPKKGDTISKPPQPISSGPIDYDETDDEDWESQTAGSLGRSVGSASIGRSRPSITKITADGNGQTRRLKRRISTAGEDTEKRAVKMPREREVREEEVGEDVKRAAGVLLSMGEMRLE